MACKNAQSQTANTRLTLLQYNWLMRVYITPEKLNQFNPNIPDLCTRCGDDKGTLIHCIWKCPRISESWNEVGKIIQDILSIQIIIEPKLFILGIYPKKHNISRGKQIFVNTCLLQAKRLIALTWKSYGRSSIRQWFKEMSFMSASRKNYLYTQGQTRKVSSNMGPIH